MLLCNHHHMKPLEESTYTPSIFASPSKDRKSATSSSINFNEKSPLKRSHELWIQLVQRLHDRTSSIKPIADVNIQIKAEKPIRREKSWASFDAVSQWHSEKLNSNKQVLTLIDHYSKMLATDTHERSTASFQDRPKSILRPNGTANKNRLTKEVKFATN